MTAVRPALVIVTALVLQTGLFTELRLDGVAADLMLVVTAAAGLTGGPDRGAGVGFACGLAVDLLLPTPLGLSALAYCLAGYGAGLLENAIAETAWWVAAPITALVSAFGMAVFVAVGELLAQPHLWTDRFWRILIIASLVNGLLAVPILRVARWMWSGGASPRPSFAARPVT